MCGLGVLALLLLGTVICSMATKSSAMTFSTTRATGDNTDDDLELLSTFDQRLSLHVNIIRRRITLQVPLSVTALPQLLADERAAKKMQVERLKLSSSQQHTENQGPPQWWLKQANGGTTYSRSSRRRRLQSSRASRSTASCVDETSFITFVNKNVRDCSWVQTQGNCDTYSKVCPVTCNLCSGSSNNQDISLQQILSGNLQQHAPTSSLTSTSTTKEDSATTSNTDDTATTTDNADSSTTVANTSKKNSNNNNDDNTQTSSINSGTTSSDVVLVNLSFTTLTANQRQRLRTGEMSIKEITNNLVTADDILSGDSNTGSKVLQAIVMSISQIINSDTDYVVISSDDSSSSTDATTTTSNTVTMTHNPLSYNDIASDGSEGWVQLHIPYETTINSQRSLTTTTTTTTEIQQITKLCNQVIQNRIADGTLFQMLDLSITSRIKAVSVIGNEENATNNVGSSNSSSNIGQSSNGMSSLTFFAAGVSGVVVVALLVLWARFTVDRMKRHKHELWARSDDTKDVTLELDLENGELKKKQKNDTTLDSSLPSEGSDTHFPSASESSETKNEYFVQPSVCVSSIKDICDVSVASSNSGRVRDFGSVATNKLSNLRTIERRKLLQQQQRKGSIEAITTSNNQEVKSFYEKLLFSAPTTTKLKTQQQLSTSTTSTPQDTKTFYEKLLFSTPTTTKPKTQQQEQPKMNFRIQSMGVPVTLNDNNNQSEQGSTTESIFGKIRRSTNKNEDDETNTSILSSSNHSLWGEEDLADELIKVDNVIFADFDVSSNDEIPKDASVHYIDVKAEGGDVLFLSDFDESNDAVFDSLYNSTDASAADVSKSTDEGDASDSDGKSLYTDESQSTCSQDKTVDYINPNIEHAVINSEHSTGKAADKNTFTTSSSSNSNKQEDTYFAESVHMSEDFCCEDFSNMCSDPRELVIAGQKLLPTTNDLKLFFRGDK